MSMWRMRTHLQSSAARAARSRPSGRLRSVFIDFFPLNARTGQHDALRKAIAARHLDRRIGDVQDLNLDFVRRVRNSRRR